MRAFFGQRHPADTRHPVPVRVGGRFRPIQTGGGLLCPGRREPQHRLPPKLPGIYGIVKDFVGRSFPDPEAGPGGGTETLIGCLRRATLRGFRIGTKKGISPFPKDRINQIRNHISKHQQQTGYPNELSIRERQPFYLSLLASMGTGIRDEESSLPRQVHRDGGVPLGVREHLPSVEPHYPSDKTPPDPDLEPPIDPDLDNYASHKENVEDIKATYEEEKLLGMVAGPFTSSEASDFLKGEAPVFLPLGARPEKDKIRSIQDGSAPGTNYRIKEHCLTRIPLPGIQDTRQAVAIAKRDGIPLAMLQLDFSKAHRRIPIL